MLTQNLISNPILILGFVISFLVAFTVHEFGHAYIAHKLGDDTAKINGRLSLNPLVHLDVIGTISLVLFGLGWGKPVPINPNNFKNPKIDSLKVALAGPLSNLIAVIIFSLILRFIPFGALFASVMYLMIEINIVLMIFNLIPIPPLDGSNILSAILPESYNEAIQELSMPLFIAFIIFALSTNYLSQFISITTNFFLSILFK